MSDFSSNLKGLQFTMGAQKVPPEEHSVTYTKQFFRSYKEFVCGWGAAAVNILVTFPLNKVIFKQMVHNVSIVTAVQQLSSEGILRLYRGVLPPLCQKSLSISIMFGVYDKCHRPLAEHGVQPVLAKATAGIAAGTLEATLVPFERVQTLLQHERYHKVLENMKHTMYLLWERQGLREYYRGLTPVLLRNGPSNACFFILRDEAKSRLPDPDNIVGRTLNQFVIGAFIGALCSTMFYPCNVVKVHMQSRIGGPFQSFPSAVLEIYHDRGSSVRGFFRGVHLNYTRSCISWGVINVAYEGLKRVLERHIA